MNTIKVDHEVIRILGLKEIRRIICDTDMGTLKLLIRKGETQYHLELDAVPLLPSVNKELMTLLFPVPAIEKPKEVNKTAWQEKETDIFLNKINKPKQVNKEPILVATNNKTGEVKVGIGIKADKADKADKIIPKKMGRPAKSKSGVKME